MSEYKPDQPIPLYDKDAHADLTKHCREAMLTAQTELAELDISLTYPTEETIVNRTQEQVAVSEPTLEGLIAKARERNINRFAESVCAYNDMVYPHLSQYGIERTPRWRIVVRRLKNAWAALKGAEISDDF